MCLFFSCSAPKNEDAYEIAIPYEENNFEQQGFFNQSDQNFDGEYQKQYFKSHFYLYVNFILHTKFLDMQYYHSPNDPVCPLQSQPHLLAHPQSTTHTW